MDQGSPSLTNQSEVVFVDEGYAWRRCYDTLLSSLDKITDYLISRSFAYAISLMHCSVIIRTLYPYVNLLWFSLYAYTHIR